MQRCKISCIHSALINSVVAAMQLKVVLYLKLSTRCLMCTQLPRPKPIDVSIALPNGPNSIFLHLLRCRCMLVCGTTDANGDSSAGEGNSSCTTPNGTPGVVNLQQFCAMMEEVLTTRRGPRTYLAPSPPRKYVHTETYKPQIDERSKQLAAKVRPKVSTIWHPVMQCVGLARSGFASRQATCSEILLQVYTCIGHVGFSRSYLCYDTMVNQLLDFVLVAVVQDTPLYEFLYQESTVLNQKKSERRARAVAEEASACTFAPRLVSQQLVREGRVMRVSIAAPSTPGVCHTSHAVHARMDASGKAVYALNWRLSEKELLVQAQYSPADSLQYRPPGCC